MSKVNQIVQQIKNLNKGELILLFKYLKQHPLNRNGMILPTSIVLLVLFLYFKNNYDCRWYFLKKKK